jgi:nitroimidazol reductase NimA-like FMN-containing flavoprotein (pyridoxamine 5'-phosphate oxidase superfamily)
VIALIERERFMTLATADAGGRPWASPVWYAPDGDSALLWLSAPETRHSRNLAVRPEVAIVIFDSRQTPGNAEAVYMEARAEEAAGGLEVFSARSVAQGLPEWTPEKLGDRLRLYRAVVSRHWELDALDQRVPVSP